MCKATCKKCDISKCHAECCTWVPLSEQFIQRYSNKIQRQIYAIDTCYDDDNGVTIGKCITHLDPITPELIEELKARGEKLPTHGEKFYVDKLKQKCPFLTDDCKCVVYENRSELCRVYGTTCESDNSLTCHYHLGKNYHFPKDGTPERKKINDFKYFVRDIYNNDKLFKEMFPGINKQSLYNKLKSLHFI